MPSRSYPSLQNTAVSIDELWEFLSTWEDHPDSDFPSTDPGTRASPHGPFDTGTSTTIPIATGPQRPKPLTSRARQHAEINALKQEAQVLSKTFSHLREKQRSQKPRTLDKTRQRSLLIAETWEQAATRERGQLDDALRGNKRLRLCVVEEKKLLKKLKQMIWIRVGKVAVRTHTHCYI